MGSRVHSRTCAQLRELGRQIEVHGPFERASARVKREHAARHVLVALDDHSMTREPCCRGLLDEVRRGDEEVERAVAVDV